MAKYKRHPIVYMATNKINGHRYIGATVKPINMRKYEHTWDATKGNSSCAAFHSAIRKYGIGAFKWETLGGYRTSKDAFSHEMLFIKKYKPEYNISKGGWNPLYDLPRTPMWKSKIRKALLGRKPSRLAAIMAAESNRIHNRKSVVCLNDGRLFDSILSAAWFYKIEPSRISTVCRRKEISADGKYFSFSKRKISKRKCISLIAFLERRRAKFKERFRASRRKPVICINTGAQFKSASSAARFYRLNNTTVSNICRGATRQTRSGLKFRFKAVA